MLDAKNILTNVFGYKSFRGNQEEVIRHTLDGNNSFVLMPTGGGKSLCYQIPALLFDGITIVISPLLALIHDQVSMLQSLGVGASYLSSNTSFDDYKSVISSCKHNQIKLLYITPERAVLDKFIDLLMQIKVSLFVIDEAHCVSHWGDNFRPDYQKLQILLKKFISVPRMALTATADKFTQIDIKHYLLLADAKIFCGSFLRDNIIYLAYEKSNSKNQLLQFLQSYKNLSGIIYCATRARVESINQFLQLNNYNALPYHAGLDDTTRINNQCLFMQNQVLIMVATIAFGLGINKPDIGYVYHFDMPKSIDSFYQESGRAGRDGRVAYSIVSFGFRDIIQQNQLILSTESDLIKKRYLQDKLKQIAKYCDIVECRRKVLLSFMGEESDNCNKCDNCINQTQLIDLTTLAQKIISTIYKVNQKFSTSHIIDILRAKNTLDIKIWEHEKLSTYGMCAEYSVKELRRIIRILHNHNYLDMDYLSGQLKLNANSLAILKGKKEFRINNYSVKNSKKSYQLSIVRTKFSLRNMIDQQIYNQLLSWRYQQSILEKTTLYHIISDNSLLEIVEQKPSTITELQSISGIGQVRLNKYADSLLNIITQPKFT